MPVLFMAAFYIFCGVGFIGNVQNLVKTIRLCIKDDGENEDWPYGLRPPRARAEADVVEARMAEEEAAAKERKEKDEYKRNLNEAGRQLTELEARMAETRVAADERVVAAVAMARTTTAADRAAARAAAARVVEARMAEVRAGMEVRAGAEEERWAAHVAGWDGGRTAALARWAN
jgi:hypothetical protein